MAERIFMLVSYLVDDNDEMISEPTPLAATKSEKVAKAVAESFIKNRNNTKTPVWDDAINKCLPGAIPETSSAKIEEIMNDSPEDRLFNMVNV